MAPEISTLIRTGMQCGRLPLFSKGHQLFGGLGDGDTCSCCGETITTTQVQYEVDFGQSGAPLRMHLRCYQIWYGETKVAGPKDKQVS